MKWFFRNSPQLAADEVSQLVERAAVVSDTSLPLASGLRAAAAEVSSRRLRRVIQQLAGRLDEGASWPQLLSEQLQHCPPDLRGTLHAATESGHVDEVLSHYVRQRTIRRDLILSIRGVLAYPALLLLLAVILLVAFSTSVLPEIISLFQDFELLFRGPLWFVGWWEHTGVWLLLKAIPVALVAVLLVRLAIGAARWRRLLYCIPLIGRVWQWLGVMEWSRMLSLYVRYHIPLPQAIQWASAGSPDADIRLSGLELARGIEDGNPLSQVAEHQQRWPSMLAPLLRSGEATRDLPGALSQAAEYFEERLQMRLTLLRTIAPPLLFTLVGTGIIVVYAVTLMIAHMAISPWTWFMPNRLDMDQSVIHPIGLLGPLGFGSLLIWTVLVTQGQKAVGREESLLHLLELMGWMLLVGSAIGYLFVVFGPLTWIFFAISVVVALVLAQRYRDAQKRALVHTLTVAAEQRVPLGEAVRAFARERSMASNHRICELADLLEAGLPLAPALKQVRLHLPSESALAVHVGRDTGQLGEALRESLTWTAATHSVLMSLFEKLVYVLLILGVGPPLIYTIVDSMVPIMRGIAGELGSEQLRSLTVWQGIQDTLGESAIGWIVFLSMFAVAGLIGTGAACLLFYVRWLSSDLPLVRRLWFPWERAVVLHALSTAVRHRQSIGESLRVLHTYHPKRSVRRRLEKAFRMTNAGLDWRAGLLKTGFINQREAAVLHAAERVDNVGWALREVANHRLRRVTLSVHRLLNMTVPLLVIIAGLFVLAIAATQFDMLSSIIQLGARL